MSDERRGKPSASGIHRLVACPGSWLMEKDLPETTSEDAEEGRILHAVMAGERSSDDLTEDQRWCIDRCRELEAQVIAQVWPEEDAEYEEMREVRVWDLLWLGQAKYSGQSDYTRRGRNCTVVIDYKFGRIAVDPAEANWQMLTLGVLADCHRRPDATGSTYVATIQPRTSNQVTICAYSQEQLAEGDKIIEAAINAAQRPDAPRIPGESQCRYCKAKDRCPEAIGVAVELALPAVPALTGEQYAEILPKIAVAEKVIKALKDGAKALLQAGGAIPGYELKPGASQREIEDPQAAFAALSDIITPEEFLSACGVSVVELEKLYGEKAGLKGAARTAAFNERMAGAITSKAKSASLGAAS